MCKSTASFVSAGNLLEGHSTTSQIEASLAADAKLFCIPLISKIFGMLQN